jgi:hypothetical protein
LVDDFQENNRHSPAVNPNGNKTLMEPKLQAIRQMHQHLYKGRVLERPFLYFWNAAGPKKLIFYS